MKSGNHVAGEVKGHKFLPIVWREETYSDLRDEGYRAPNDRSTLVLACVRYTHAHDAEH